MKKFCSYLQVPVSAATRQPMPKKRFEVRAPVVEAALMTHAGEVQPGLILEDGTAVVLTFGQASLLSKLLRDWGKLVPTEEQDGGNRYVGSMEVPA